MECIVGNKNYTMDDQHQDDLDSGTPSNRIFQHFNHFMKWRFNAQIDGYSEAVLLEYFRNISSKSGIKGVKEYYTNIKTMLLAHKDINIQKYEVLRSFLRKLLQYGPDRANAKPEPNQKRDLILTTDQLKKFVCEAPDEHYLVHKIVMFLCIAGSLGIKDLIHLCLDDIEEQNSSLIINIRDSKNTIKHTFCIIDDGSPYNFIGLYKKYISLRPCFTLSKEFFLQYYKGKCKKQVMGERSLAGIPFSIAKFLNLPNSVLYTGSSIRCASDPSEQSNTKKQQPQEENYNQGNVTTTVIAIFDPVVVTIDQTKDLFTELLEGKIQQIKLPSEYWTVNHITNETQSFIVISYINTIEGIYSGNNLLLEKKILINRDMILNFYIYEHLLEQFTEKCESIHQLTQFLIEFDAVSPCHGSIVGREGPNLQPKLFYRDLYCETWRHNTCSFIINNCQGTKMCELCHTFLSTECKIKEKKYSQVKGVVMKKFIEKLKRQRKKTLETRLQLKHLGDWPESLEYILIPKHTD